MKQPLPLKAHEKLWRKPLWCSISPLTFYMMLPPNLICQKDDRWPLRNMYCDAFMFLIVESLDIISLQKTCHNILKNPRFQDEKKNRERLSWGDQESCFTPKLVNQVWISGIFDTSSFFWEEMHLQKGGDFAASHLSFQEIVLIISILIKDPLIFAS